MTMAWNQDSRRKGYPRLAAASEPGRKRISDDALLVAALLVSALILLATFLPIRTASLPAPVRSDTPREIGSAAFGAIVQAGRQG